MPCVWEMSSLVQNMNCAQGATINSANLWCAASMFDMGSIAGTSKTVIIWVILKSRGTEYESYIDGTFYSKEKLHKLQTDSSWSKGSRIWKWTQTQQQRVYLVLPLARAAPFELLGPWCPSFLLPGFTIDTSWCADALQSNAAGKDELCFLLISVFCFSPSSLSPLSHSPAGFSQMEVAQHSRPALHNLRMKEGGSASHYTRFEPRRWWGALVRRGPAVRTLLFFFLSRILSMRANPH